MIYIFGNTQFEVRFDTSLVNCKVFFFGDVNLSGQHAREGNEVSASQSTDLCSITWSSLTKKLKIASTDLLLGAHQ